MNTLTIKKIPKLSYECSEAINTLCTNITFLGENVKKIAFTSCFAAEGKSTMVFEVMKTMADLGYSVVLVDADMRKSVLSNRYGFISNALGLAHYLSGQVELDDVIYQTNIENAYIVPVGVNVKNTLQILNSSRLETLLNYLSQQFDYVFVDTPPIGVIIDAAQTAKYCDGVILVVKYNTVSKKALLSVQKQLEQAHCDILGTVLSMVELKSFINKHYYYRSNYESYYGYYAEPDRKKKTDKTSKTSKTAKASKTSKASKSVKEPARGKHEAITKEKTKGR